MMLRKKFWRGLTFGGIVLFALIFLPPLFAPKLEAWDEAARLLPHDEELKKLCGTDTDIQLSRWLYTYKFSGEEAFARFKGKAQSKSCQIKFEIELQRQHGIWSLNAFRYQNS